MYKAQAKSITSQSDNALMQAVGCHSDVCVWWGRGPPLRRPLRGGVLLSYGGCRCHGQDDRGHQRSWEGGGGANGGSTFPVPSHLFILFCEC